jgi:hypothetical protein
VMVMTAREIRKEFFQPSRFHRRRSCVRPLCDTARGDSRIADSAPNKTGEIAEGENLPDCALGE